MCIQHQPVFSLPFSNWVYRLHSGQLQNGEGGGGGVGGRRERERRVHVCDSILSSLHRLGGLVVKASASRAEDPGFESCLRRDFFWVESYQ